jgi:HD-like signal output (HDOD) protein
MPDWTSLRKSLLPEKAMSVLPPSVQLPVLPKALMEFNQKAQDPEVETVELSRIIATDAGLSSELLRQVNSCRTGVRTNVTSVQQALVTLGIRAVQSHLITSGLKQVMKSTSSKLINFQNFWNTNLERALFARELAALFRADVDLAFTAGMLQDFLLPLITNQNFEVYLEFTEYREEHSSLVAFERERFKWDHAEAVALVMCGWQFPDELICCVYLHHQSGKLLVDPQLSRTSAAAVAVSALLPDAMRQESDGLQRLIELETQWPQFQLLPLAEKIDTEFQSIAQNTQNHFSLLRSVQKALSRSAEPGCSA